MMFFDLKWGKDNDYLWLGYRFDDLQQNKVQLSISFCSSLDCQGFNYVAILW